MKRTEIIIESGKSEKNYWFDFWNYRELFYILAWRDIKVRYKQTVLGFAWSLIRPFLTMIIFTFVFNKIAHLPSESNAPYAILVLAGTLPWQFFSNSLAESSGSLIGNSHLISKVYFPRLIIPASSVIVNLIDLFISFFILLILMIWYQFIPSGQIIFLPLFILLAFLVSIGPGILLTALNVKYRDFRYIVPFIIQFGLFISPVGFSSNILPEKWKVFYSINPMVGVIDGFRWSIIGGDFNLYSSSILFSIIFSIIAIFFSVKYFRSTEKKFADII
jgi:lipopolysaccharide transport system permease protein